MASDGYFSEDLDVDQELFSGQQLWLGVEVAGDSEMSPRQRILPVPYALGVVPGALMYGSELTATLTISNTGTWFGGTLNYDPIPYENRFDYLNGVKVNAAGDYTYIRDWVGYTSTETIDLGVGVNTRGTIAGIYARSDASQGYGGYFVSNGESGYGIYATGNNVGIGSFVLGNDTGILGSSGALVGGACGGVGVCGIGQNEAGVRGESVSAHGMYAVNNTSVATKSTLKIVNKDSGDLIRGYGNTGVTVEESELVFRVTAAGDVYGDGSTYHTPADFAEMMAVAGNVADYEPGDVLVISPDVDRAVDLAAEAYSSAVAGIYSTDPGFVAGYTEDATGQIPVAVVGIVPCKVSAENGSIQRGDLLTTSDIPGHAMKVTDRSNAIGAILGKALAPLESGTGVIPVLVMLQ
jgi:hypothetical protein